MFTTLLTAYYVSVLPICHEFGVQPLNEPCSWDTSMSQKSRFKMQTQGIYKFRNTFPQLPWNVVKNPTYIQTVHGYDLVLQELLTVHLPKLASNRLLTSGWWAYSRKPVSPARL